jgi:hypothetical protein
MTAMCSAFWLVGHGTHPVHQAVLGVLAVGIYLDVTSVFRLGGHRHGSVSEEEYAQRLREIDTRLYTHVGGMPSAETGRNSGALVRRNGDR